MARLLGSPHLQAPLAILVLLVLLAPSRAPAAPGDLLWSYSVGSIQYSCPAVSANGTIYVGSSDNKLYALNPDGTQQWAYLTPSDVVGSPAVSINGTIYVGSLDKKLYALNPDGTLQWSYPAGSAIYSSPAVSANGTIYVGSNDRKLHALNPDGTLQWSYLTGSSVLSSPAVSANGTIYVGSGDKKLYVLNPDGTLQWAYGMGGAIQMSSPAVSANGTIYVGNADNKLYALNPDGTLQWTYTTGGDVVSSPAVSANGTIYVGSRDRNLYALNPDGTLQWSYTTGGMIYASPALSANGTAVYVGSNRVYAVEGGAGGLMESAWPKFHQNQANLGREEGLVWLYPGQTTVTVDFKWYNCTACNATDIASCYHMEFTPRTSLSAFNCTVTPPGSMVTFMLDAHNLNGTARGLSLAKFSDSSHTGRTFGTYSSANATGEGAWWLTNSSYGYIPRDEELDANATYFVCYNLRDNGAYDNDPALGVILDPVAAGVAPAAPSSFSPLSDSTGCVLNPHDGPQPGLLVLLAAGAGLFLLRRKRTTRPD